MELLDIALNYILGIFLGIICLMTTMSFPKNKKDIATIRDWGLLQIILHFIFVPFVIIIFGLESGSNMSKGPVISPFWGAIPFQFLHYIIWAVIAYNLKPTNKNK